MLFLELFRSIVTICCLLGMITLLLMVVHLVYNLSPLCLLLPNPFIIKVRICSRNMIAFDYSLRVVIVLVYDLLCRNLLSLLFFGAEPLKVLNQLIKPLKLRCYLLLILICAVPILIFIHHRIFRIVNIKVSLRSLTSKDFLFSLRYQ